MRNAFLTVLALCFTTVASAQHWESAGGPGRGKICGVVVSPDSHLYVISKNLLRSTDKGATWQRIGPALALSSTRLEPPARIAWNKNGDMIMAVDNLIRRSIDGGVSWSNIGGVSGSYDFAITQRGIIFAGNTTNIMVSPDDAATWLFTTPSPSYAGERFFVDINGTAYTSDAENFLVSRNSGALWTAADSLKGISPEDMLNLPDGRLLLADDDKLFLINDSTLTKTLLHTAGAMIVSLAYTNDTLFYIRKDGVLCRSADDGLTWVQVGPALAEYPGNLVAHGSTLYLRCHWTLYARELWETGPWREVVIPNSEVTAMTVSTTGTIIATTKIYGQDFSQWSLEQGGDWTPQVYWEAGLMQDLAIDSGGTIYGIVSQTFARYYPDENAWRYGISLPGKTAQIAAGKDALFIAAYGILTSTDRGLHWLPTADTTKSFSVVSVLPDVLYAAGVSVFFRSFDRGVTWENPSFPFSIGPNQPKAIAARDQNVVIAVERTGIFFSSDRGNTWQDYSSGIAPDSINQLLLTPDGSIFAATTGGVYQYHPFLQKWVTITYELPPGTIEALILGPDDKLYVGTDGEGVFRSTKTYHEWYKSIDRVARADRPSLFPNPASDIVSIHSKEPLPERSVFVYDLLGRSSVVPYLDGSLDVSSLVHGQYFVRIVEHGEVTILPLTIAR